MSRAHEYNRVMRVEEGFDTVFNRVFSGIIYNYIVLPYSIHFDYILFTYAYYTYTYVGKYTSKYIYIVSLHIYCYGSWNILSQV